MNSIKKAMVAAALLAAASGTACAAAGDILVRARAIRVQPDVSASGALSSLDAGVKAATVPELDFTYMFTDHVGVELILATTRHRVTSGIGSLGKVSVLPPTVTLQYHFNSSGRWRPYVGAGLNYTRFYDNDLSAGGQPVHIDRNSFGPALQLGMDIGIDDDWFFNVDVKKIWIRTDASQAGNDLGRLKIDPWIVGAGIGRRF